MKIDLSQLDFVDGRVKTLAREVEAHFRVEFEVTSLYRIGDDGVHGTLPCRGIDLGCKDAIIGNRVADFLNKRWEYDPKRPEKLVCMYHAKKGGQPHLHLQSHPNTEKRYHD
ncbi:MAG: hypothetical protein GY753_11825 [Gammaproteobacteria bacterium]|nr:hypothetical protein [Gammaproteobacteria bacterium]